MLKCRVISFVGNVIFIMSCQCNVKSEWITSHLTNQKSQKEFFPWPLISEEVYFEGLRTSRYEMFSSYNGASHFCRPHTDTQYWDIQQAPASQYRTVKTRCCSALSQHNLKSKHHDGTTFALDTSYDLRWYILLQLKCRLISDNIILSKKFWGRKIAADSECGIKLWFLARNECPSWIKQQLLLEYLFLNLSAVGFKYSQKLHPCLSQMKW